MTTEMMTLDAARALAVQVLRANGCDEPNARAIAEVMILAERDGCASHGLFRLPGYVASLRSGKIDGTARPSLERIAPGILRVDAHGGAAPLAFETGRDPLAALAREQGIAALVLRDIYHFAALWPEVEALAERGLCAFAFTAATPMVAPAGGTAPFFGTNPMAFGFPRKAGPPFVFDQASAAMARGDVMIHARDRVPLPEGVGIDAEGHPTTDAAEVLKGAQLPFGGHKGSSIALMIELLVGALIGDLFSYESGERDNGDGGPPAGGELILALDPDRFGDRDSWRDHAEAFFACLREQPGVRLPGDRRRRMRETTLHGGITIPAPLAAEIRRLL